MSDSTHKSLVQHQFGRSAGDYATNDFHAVGESLAVLNELIAPQKDWRILDVATGAGHTGILFAPMVAEVVATDITDEMLAETLELAGQRKIANLTTAIADAESLPFDDQSFDMVTCRLAHHHFVQQQKAIEEFARVLKPGGIIGFTDNYTVEDPAAAEFYNRYEKIRDPSHFQVHSLGELEQLFANAGLVIKDSRQLTQEFEFHKWADRQRVTDSDKELLLDMLDEAPELLIPLFKPRKADGTAYFSLAEVVLVAETMTETRS